MGAAAGALAAAEQPGLADALVMDSSYSLMTHAVMGWWRLLFGKLSVLFAPTILVGWPFMKVNPFKVDVAEALSKVNVPVLFIHGQADPLAIASHAQRNFDLAVGDKKLVWIEGWGHCEGRWRNPSLYQSELISFLEAYGFISREHQESSLKPIAPASLADL